MTLITSTLRTAATVAALLASCVAGAQPAQPLAQGEIRKIDKAAGKVTIKHGDIPSIEMPPMTMVFTVKDPTLLDGVKAGDKATVYPRAYFGSKSFEGIVVANPFGVSRQMNQPFSGAPIVQTENKWLLLPQRLPVIIKITDPDSKYPLINGMSTYVRIQR